jgi:hypothetical protein
MDCDTTTAISEAKLKILAGKLIYVSRITPLSYK